MSKRLRYKDVAPEATRALSALQAQVVQFGLEAQLIELVYLRVSQINGCAYCVHLHSKNMRAAGEAERRIDTLVVWREAPGFSSRERLALEWAESVTKLGPDHVPDALYERMAPEFSERDLVALTLAVATINAWNRMAIAFRSEPSTV
jgi:AhpD family alkylhydroperoxidase